jgi:hypothetical protein
MARFYHSAENKDGFVEDSPSPARPLAGDGEGMFRFKMTHYLVAEQVDCVFRRVLKATVCIPDAPIVRSLLYS